MEEEEAAVVVVEEDMLELPSVQPAPLEEAAGLARRSNLRYDAAGARARVSHARVRKEEEGTQHVCR